MSQDTAAHEDAQTTTTIRRVKVSIGVVFSAKELELEIEGDSAHVSEHVQRELADGKGNLVLVDTKGKSVIIPVDKLCYVEVHADETGGAIGFGF